MMPVARAPYPDVYAVLRVAYDWELPEKNHSNERARVARGFDALSEYDMIGESAIQRARAETGADSAHVLGAIVLRAYYGRAAPEYLGIMKRQAIERLGREVVNMTTECRDVAAVTDGVRYWAGEREEATIAEHARRLGVSGITVWSWQRAKARRRNSARMWCQQWLALAEYGAETVLRSVGVIP